MPDLYGKKAWLVIGLAVVGWALAVIFMLAYMSTYYTGLHYYWAYVELVNQYKSLYENYTALFNYTEASWNYTSSVLNYTSHVLANCTAVLNKLVTRPTNTTGGG